jgi:hypothetical protein
MPVTPSTGAPSDGKQPEPPAPAADSDDAAHSRWYAILVLAIAVAFGIGWAFVYTQVNSWYWPVNLLATTSNLTGVQNVLLSPARGSPHVWWHLDAASATQLTLNGPVDGRAQVDLPLPARSCASVAAVLGVGCTGSGQLVMGSPAYFTWSAPDLVLSPAAANTSASRLDIESAASSHGGPSVVLSSDTQQSPALCFSSPGTAAKLTVRVGARSDVIPLRAGQTAGCNGLSALVGVAGSGSPPAFVLSGISNLQLRAWAATGQLNGFTGSVRLRPGGTTVPGSASVFLRGRGPASLLTTLTIGPASGSLTVQSDSAQSVESIDGQLIPSVWSRYAPYLGPVLGGLVTATVVTPLGVSVQELMARLKRWRGPVRRRDRRGKNHHGAEGTDHAR